MASSVLSGTVTRQWKLGPHTIAFRHSTLSGFRYVLLDGVEVPGSEGTSSLFTMGLAGDRIRMQVADQEVCVMVCPSGKTGFRYSCTFDGEPQTEATCRLHQQDQVCPAPQPLAPSLTPSR